MPAVIAAQFKGLQWPMGLNANLIFYWLGHGNSTCYSYPWQIATDALKLNANLPASNRQGNLAESFIILRGLL